MPWSRKSSPTTWSARRVAGSRPGLISELEGIDKKSKIADKDLHELVTARGSTIMDLHGIGPSGATAVDYTPSVIARGPRAMVEGYSATLMLGDGEKLEPGFAEAVAYVIGNRCCRTISELTLRSADQV
ncbi:MAG: hypothetical protein ACRDTC_02550 [Pseudonocardiaceae bacterium]